MKKTTLLVIALLTITSIIAQDKRLKGLEKELNEALELTKAPGFAVAVVEGDKIIFAKGFGYRDYENKIPVDPNTLFAIGSSTKAFTSAILGQLEDEDKLSFDDSPLQYLPDFHFYNKKMDNQIVIKDLMSHRTGLPRHDFSWYLFPEKNKDSLLQRVQHQEPFTEVRKQWYYNNFMFLAQGVIAEKITNKTWEKNIQERFFKPLQMTRSDITIQSLADASNAALGYALGEDDKVEKMDYYDISGMSPAGAITSSVNDMSNWLMMWINKGKFKDEDILPQSYIQDAISSHMIVGPGLPSKKAPDLFMSTYGLGWFLASYKGHYRVEHGGNIDGFSASVSFFPTDKIGIVVLTNQNTSSLPDLVRNTVSDYILETEKTGWIKDYKKQLEDRKKMQKEVEKDEDNVSDTKILNTKPSHTLKDYIGNYTNLGYGTFDIELKNDSLFANFKRQKVYLKHYHYDVFEAFDVEEDGIDTSEKGGSRFNFTTNLVGDISSLNIDIEPTLDALIFDRKAKSIAVDTATLDLYVGEYELMGQTVKVYIKKDTLYVLVPGQPEYQLTAIDKHLFAIKVADGYKVKFEGKDDKNLDILAFIQPNGTFKAKRKK